MPLLSLQSSPPAAPRRLLLAGAGNEAAAAGSRRHLRVRGLANNATMLPNLRLRGRCPAVCDWSLCCRRKWRELAAGAVVVGLRNSAGAHTELGRGAAGSQGEGGVRRSRSGLGGRVRSVLDCCSSSNLAGFRGNCGGAIALDFGSNPVSGCHGIVGASGQLKPFAVDSCSGGRQVGYGWKRRERKSEDNIVFNRWRYPGGAIVRQTGQAKRVYTAVSNPHAAVAPSISETVLRKGALLEFERETGKFLLAVAQNRDGKKNWTAIDQIERTQGAREYPGDFLTVTQSAMLLTYAGCGKNGFLQESGTTHIVKPQQITYLVPSRGDFEPSEIEKFLGKVENLQDLGLLEFAWEEVLAEKIVQAGSLAKILYSQDAPVECYTVHRMLSGDQIFFRCKQKGLTPIYEPRPLSQVRELQQKRIADEKAREQLISYVKVIRLALRCPQNDKPPENTWHEVDHVRTESLKAYALSSCSEPAQKKSAEEVIEVMGLSKNPAVVVNLLIGMGVFPLHVNVDLLKMMNLVEFRKEHVAAVKQLGQCPQVDPDLDNRVDLTAMKVYTIDSDDTDEIDDGLSATRLPDGQIKVWIHVADPTRWLPQDHILSREAESRGTSIYLPTGTIPMFPMELAAGQMSLQQGRNCCAVTVSVLLLDDGSIAEYSVMNSTICPTYKLSYDNVAELLQMHVDEEPELYLLAEAATCRAQWRTSQGALLTFVPEPEIKVTDPNSTEPSIILEIKDQSVPAMQLVAEMMILCGEAVSLIGEENSLCLPYRGQAQTDFPKRIMNNIPDGPSRAFAMRRLLGGADLSYTKPIAHASLGLPGYVQFTSPIRRYSDLIAHYQVKAYMRGDVLPFSAGNLEAKMAMANIRMKDSRRLQSSAERYWTIEYLRRQPRDRQYRAVVLRYVKDREASVLLLEVGFRSSLVLSSTLSVGSEVSVAVASADPRRDVISLRQC